MSSQNITLSISSLNTSPDKFLKRLVLFVFLLSLIIGIVLQVYVSYQDTESKRQYAIENMKIWTGGFGVLGIAGLVSLACVAYIGVKIAQKETKQALGNLEFFIQRMDYLFGLILLKAKNLDFVDNILKKT